MMWVVKRIFLTKKILLITHIICFGLEIRKIIFNYSLLSGDDEQKEKEHPKNMFELMTKKIIGFLRAKCLLICTFEYGNLQRYKVTYHMTSHLGVK